MTLHLSGFHCGRWHPGDRVAYKAADVECGRCQWHRDAPRREAARRTARRSAEVRRPPRPPFQGQAGRCNLCGEPPAGRRRTWCSELCVATWWLASSSTTQYLELVELHGHRCWSCGEQWEPGEPHSYRATLGPPLPRPIRLQVDHVKPLWSLSELERTELRWWLPFNLALLCQACHSTKTRREAGERAAARRKART